MTRKTIVTLLLIMGLGITEIMAKDNTAELAKLISKQENLSKKIIMAYNKKVTDSSLLTLVNTLESEQIKLKSKIDNPEITNLLIYLSMCVNDLKSMLKKPYSSKNAQTIADLSTSIQEGSQYIRQSI